MSVSRYETSLQIVNRAAPECGLGVTAGLFASTDANFVLLRTLLNSCGQELGLMRPWRHLLKAGSFTAPAAVAPAIYGVQALPADFDYAIDGTWRNDTDNNPLQAVDAPTWEYHIDNATGIDPPIFRLDGNSVWLYAPSAGDAITYRYVSRYWVKPAAESAPTLAASTADADVLYHHPLLLARLLKLRFFQARGKESTSVMVDFETTYNMVAGGEQVSRALILGGGGPGFKYLDGSNLRDTGYGV